MIGEEALPGATPAGVSICHLFLRKRRDEVLENKRLNGDLACPQAAHLEGAIRKIGGFLSPRMESRPRALRRARALFVCIRLLAAGQGKGIRGCPPFFRFLKQPISNLQVGSILVVLCRLTTQFPHFELLFGLKAAHFKISFESRRCCNVREHVAKGYTVREKRARSCVQCKVERFDQVERL